MCMDSNGCSVEARGILSQGWNQGSHSAVCIFQVRSLAGVTLTPIQGDSAPMLPAGESLENCVAEKQPTPIAIGWSEPVSGRELYPVESSDFRGELFRQQRTDIEGRREFYRPLPISLWAPTECQLPFARRGSAGAQDVMGLKHQCKPTPCIPWLKLQRPSRIGSAP
jgi:hypothetical protein